MSPNYSSRREFIAATGATGLTASVAGCLDAFGGGSGDSVDATLFLPFSGPAQSLGNGMAAGARTEIENSDEDFDITFHERDTESDPGTALDELDATISQDGADFVIGPVSSAVANAMVDTIKQNEVIWLNCNSGSNALGRDNCFEYHFRPSFSNWQASYPLGTWTGENQDYDEIMTVGSDYTAGHEHVAGFVEGLDETGADAEITSQLFPPFGNEDFSSQLSSIASEEPDAVFTFLFGLDYLNFISGFAERGLKQDVDLLQAWGPTQDILQDVGPAAEGSISLCHYTPLWDTPENNEFRENWIDEHDRMPHEWDIHGSEAANLMLAALEETGGDASDTDAIIDALSGIEWTGPRGDVALDPANNNVILDQTVRRTVAEEDPVGNEYQNQVIDVFEDVQLSSEGCDL